MSHARLMINPVEPMRFAAVHPGGWIIARQDSSGCCRARFRSRPARAIWTD